MVVPQLKEKHIRNSIKTSSASASNAKRRESQILSTRLSAYWEPVGAKKRRSVKPSPMDMLALDNMSTQAFNEMTIPKTEIKTKRRLSQRGVEGVLIPFSRCQELRRCTGACSTKLVSELRSIPGLADDDEALPLRVLQWVIRQVVSETKKK